MSDTGVLGASATTLEALAEVALDLALRVLQRRPDLVNTLQELFGSATSTPNAAPVFMSIAQYAVYRCVSDRTVRYDLKKMEAGEQFHLAGRRGGRVVVHVQEADAWYKQREAWPTDAQSVEKMAIDEVTRRRARLALKKRKES